MSADDDHDDFTITPTSRRRERGQIMGGDSGAPGGPRASAFSNRLYARSQPPALSCDE